MEINTYLHFLTITLEKKDFFLNDKLFYIVRPSMLMLIRYGSLSFIISISSDFNSVLLMVNGSY